MRKFGIRGLWTIALIALLATPALADGNANFLIGGRGLDEDFWEPVDGQGVIGATVDFGGASWPINMEAGFYASAAEDELFDSTLLADVDVTGAVVEFCFGVNKTWKPQGNVRPFIGGGLSSVAAALDLDAGIFGDVDDDDSSLGAYVHGGVFWRIGSRFNIGLDARILTGTDIELFGVEGDADYFQLGMLLGWGWPATK